MELLKKARAMKDSQTAVPYYEQVEHKWFEAKDFAVYAEGLHYIGRTQEGIAIIEKGLTHFPDDAYLHGVAGHIFREDNREEEALIFLNKAISLEDYYWYYYTRALVHQDLGYIDEALADYKQAIKREEELGHPQVNSSWYEYGYVLFDHGFVDKALAAFQQAVQSEDNAVPMFYYRLAKAYEENDELDAALENMEKACQLLAFFQSMEDEGLQLYWDRARYSADAVHTFQSIIKEGFDFLPDYAHLLLETDQTEEAEEALNEAIHRYPDAFSLYIERGILLFELEKYEESLADFHRAQELDEKDPDPQYWLSRVHYFSGNLHQALVHCHELVKLDSEDASVYKLRAQLYGKLGRFEKAENDYTIALEKEEDMKDQTLRERSFVRYQQGKFEQAYDDLLSALQENPSLNEVSEYALDEGMVLLGMGYLEEAEQSFTKGIELEPDSPVILEKLARCRLSQEKFQEALEDCDIAIEVAPEYTALYHLRGFIHLRMGQLEQALTDIEQFIERVPSSFQGYVTLGLIYESLGKDEEAEELYNMAITINAFIPEPYYRRAFLRAEQGLLDEAASDYVQWVSLYGKELSTDTWPLLLEQIEDIDKTVLKLAQKKIKQIYGKTPHLLS
ncbi:tetratricopeptide repeat protein [Bacillus sp. FJAT-42315]|uniref:tetratricopeptide repeat protein n=1 Tax=Bacillus sp. FJAT-42315 TaxID=2014077 RepID=UPI000C231912|nr:tetratricopeptide repeat protein [Bacillus sp. FJAT-42315]